MKKLSLYIFLVLMWCNVGFANDISKIEDIEINGMRIGDNLLDHFSKQELIQEKKLLKAVMSTKKLYYTSVTDQGMFYYESNERVGMTENPIYRIIGMTLYQSCDENSYSKKFSKVESLELLRDCINETFKIGKKFNNDLLNLLNLYFEKKYDSININVMEDGSLYYYKDLKLGNCSGCGCHSDKVEITYYSMITTNSERIFDKKKKKFIKKNTSMYYPPSMSIFLKSKELDQLTIRYYC